MRYLPIALDVRNRPCLVVGGGQVAQRKIEWLRAAGARIEVVARRANEGVLALHTAGALTFAQRDFDDADVQDAHALVIAATDDRDLNAHISTLAQRRGVLVNVVDEPALCSFIVPALVERGPLSVGISTEGASPVLARLVRRRIESVLPLELGALARFAATHRQRVKTALPDPTQRRTFWDLALEGPVARHLLRGDEPAATAELEAALRAASLGDYGALATPELAVFPDAGIEALTLGAMRALGRADVVYFDPATESALGSFARRDAQLVPFVATTQGTRDALDECAPGLRVCFLCTEAAAGAVRVGIDQARAPGRA